MKACRRKALEESNGVVFSEWSGTPGGSAGPAGLNGLPLPPRAHPRGYSLPPLRASKALDEHSFLMLCITMSLSENYEESRA